MRPIAEEDLPRLLKALHGPIDRGARAQASQAESRRLELQQHSHEQLDRLSLQQIVRNGDMGLELPSDEYENDDDECNLESSESDEHPELQSKDAIIRLLFKFQSIKAELQSKDAIIKEQIEMIETQNAQLRTKSSLLRTCRKLLERYNSFFACHTSSAASSATLHLFDPPSSCK
jgi:hypothetical protein